MRGTRFALGCWSCALAFALVSAACDRGSSETSQASSEGAENAPASARSAPGTIDDNFAPSVPAVWESSDPKTELEGQEALLDYLNDLRAAHNLKPLSVNEKLQAAAASHAKYIEDNKPVESFYVAVDASGASIHVQDPKLPGFTGETYVERGEHFGYEGECIAEVVAFKPTAVGAGRSWAESLYHRFPLLEANAVHIGYAELQLESTKVNVMKVGSHDQQ